MSGSISSLISIENKPVRASRTLSITVEEKPERSKIILKNNRARDKFITTVEKYIRSSLEYSEYIKHLKTKTDMKRCALCKISSDNGKKYSIEMHHDPFRLYDMVDIEIIRRELEGEPLDILSIAEAVTELHYEGIVGLIPLSKTQHDLVHSFNVFIPLSQIYHDYAAYYRRYEDIIDSNTRIRDMLEAKIKMSLACDDIQSTCYDPEFVYLDVDGVRLPHVPDEWKTQISTTYMTLAVKEEQDAKEAKKAEKNSVVSSRDILK